MPPTKAELYQDGFSRSEAVEIRSAGENWRDVAHKIYISKSRTGRFGPNYTRQPNWESRRKLRNAG